MSYIMQIPEQYIFNLMMNVPNTRREREAVEKWSVSFPPAIFSLLGVQQEAEFVVGSSETDRAQ